VPLFLKQADSNTNRSQSIVFLALINGRRLSLAVPLQDDYYADSSGALVPIRWLAPEVISFTNGNGMSLRHITKDCNLWLNSLSLQLL